MQKLRHILVATTLLFYSYGYAGDSKAIPVPNPAAPAQFEVPETQFEKLQKLDDFNGEIDLCKKEIEEWKRFRSTVDNAYSLSITNRSVSNLTDIVANLKNAIIKTQKNPGNLKFYDEQIMLEQELIEKVEGLIPFQLKIRYDWNQTTESRDVRSEIQQFQLANQEILGKITKDGSYYNGAVTGAPLNRIIFNNSADLDAYIAIVKMIVEKGISTHLSEFIKKIDGKIIDTESKIQLAKDNINKIYRDDDKKFSINSLAIWVGLPAFCITILLLYLIPEWFTRHNPEKKHDFSALLQLITVFLLTMTILILGLSGLLSGEVLGTLIGGISGYVLNKTVTQVKANTTT